MSNLLFLKKTCYHRDWMLVESVGNSNKLLRESSEKAKSWPIFVLLIADHLKMCDIAHQ